MRVGQMNVAFIPVRGGSKSIPLKNIKKICGKPLVYYTVLAACQCDDIDRVYVATDSDEIRSAIHEFVSGSEAEMFKKLAVIGRSAESATDTASTESAMLEFAEHYSFDHIVLIQATSPLLTDTDLANGFAVYRQPDTDSVLSVVPQKRFHWAENEEGIAHSSNYDVYHRPRRQDFSEYYVENGAFYITSKENLCTSGNRVSGNIRLAKMSAETYLEIDEPEDFLMIETLMKRRMNHEGSLDYSKIKLVLTDCDGCLTDGGMYYSEQGDELKKFNTKDGLGMRLLHENHILTGIITGEIRELNVRRAEKLQVDYLRQGCTDKAGIVEDLLKELEMDWDQLLYIGDDCNDLSVMEKAGISCCPADAVDLVRDQADYVAERKGGEGVIREVVELLLHQNGLL